MHEIATLPSGSNDQGGSTGPKTFGASLRARGQALGGRLTAASMSLYTRAGQGSFKRDDHAEFGVAGIMAVAFSVIGTVIVMFLLAGLAGGFFNSTVAVREAITTTDFGDPTINTLRSPLGLLLVAAALLGFIGLALSRLFD